MHNVNNKMEIGIYPSFDFVVWCDNLMIVNRFWRVDKKGAGTYMSLLGVLRR